MERLIAHLGRESPLRAQWAAADRGVWAKAMTVPSGKQSLEHEDWKAGWGGAMKMTGKHLKYFDLERASSCDSGWSWTLHLPDWVPWFLSHSTQLATWAISCMWMCACTNMHMCGFCCSTQHFLNYFSGNKSRTQYFLHHHFISFLSFSYTP